MNRSWEPVRSGDTYCSPGCGRGCTIHQYNAAQVVAQELVDALGPASHKAAARWEKHVHENLGWHGSAVLKVDGQVWANIYKNSQDYLVYIESRPQVAGRGRTPAEAVRAALGTLEAQINNLKAHGNAVRDSIREGRP